MHELVDGHCFFSSLKFLTTSYNNEGVKFHLLLTIFIKNENGEHPKILSSVISQPIFVDSRKTARDNIQIFEKKISSILEPFLPESLDKILIKREAKGRNTEGELEIENNIDGLFNYLTAPNIRHKVKHPIFLLIKFSDTVSLFFNSQQFSFSSLEQLLESLQNTLNEDSRDDNSDDDSWEGKDNSLRSFLILIRDEQDSPRAKKILEAIEHLNTRSLAVIFSESEVPANFSPPPNEKPLVEAYKNIYVKLFTASKINQPTNIQDDSENSEHQNNNQNHHLNQNHFPHQNIEEAGVKKVKMVTGEATTQPEAGFHPPQEEFPISSAAELQKLNGNKAMAPIMVTEMQGLQDSGSGSPTDPHPQPTGNLQSIQVPMPQPEEIIDPPKEVHMESFEDRMKKAEAEMSLSYMQQNNTNATANQSMHQMPSMSQMPPSSNPQMEAQKQQMLMKAMQMQNQLQGAGGFFKQNNNSQHTQPQQGQFNQGMFGAMSGMMPQLSMIQQYQNMLNQQFMSSMMMQQYMRQQQDKGQGMGQMPQGMVGQGMNQAMNPMTQAMSQGMNPMNQRGGSNGNGTQSQGMMPGQSPQMNLMSQMAQMYPNAMSQMYSQPQGQSPQQFPSQQMPSNPQMNGFPFMGQGQMGFGSNGMQRKEGNE